ncbi:hypothetical protein ERO13_D05G050050v2 [Gossypium hirsutum]|uniref:Uncharacterized protein n=2 Tax=Gossypium TaxID=3633 RepID=A0A5D2UUW6_GOSMU|nr:hypothetical protein ERO13_D05G050050v2 [Gossypium hirsutum]TYG67126.1 hypothetical protein ES288_D05G053200v1 [Gossypium darwinii]TYI79886.1 hypothetical protein E1A91_D05G052800v1 [Gossypium mustelinum]
MRRSVEGWTTSFAASTSFTVPFSFKRSVRLPCLRKIGKGPKLLIPKGTPKTNVIVTLFQVKKGETKSYFV